MSEDYTSKAFQDKLSRLKGMSEEASKTLEAFNAEQTDWFAVCPKCKARVSGTLAQVKGHSCGSKD